MSDDYDWEINRVKSEIKGAKTVCLQVPDGLKRDVNRVVDELEKDGIRVLIWAGDCFGACDVPQGLQQFDVDMLVSWGHSRFIKKEGWS
jgi:diphthamide biosynthesis enzyme Dph1/Dph2-like protein